MTHEIVSRIFAVVAVASAVSTHAMTWRFNYDRTQCLMAMCSLSIVLALVSVALR